MEIRKRPITTSKAKPVEKVSPPESSPYRPYYLYGLAEGDVIFYIGMTNDINRRYQQHLAGDENQRKTGRIMHIFGRVDVKILDTAMNLEEAQQLEAFWILYHILDQQYLTNTHMGAALDLMDLDNEHTEKLANMLQRRWGEEGFVRWDAQRNSRAGRGGWKYLKSITAES